MSAGAARAERVLLPTADRRTTRAVLRVLIRPHRAPLVGSIAVLVAGSIAGISVAPLFGRIVDHVVDGDSYGAVAAVGLTILGVTVLSGLLDGCGTGLLSSVMERILAGLRERVVGTILRLPLSDVERAGVGDVASRVGSDVESVSEAASSAVPGFVSGMLGVLLSLAGMAVLDWRLGLVGLVAAPIQGRALWWYLPWSRPVYERMRVIEGERAEHLLTSVAGAPTVRALRIGPARADLVDGAAGQVVALHQQATALVTRFYGRLNLAEFVGTSSVLVAGFYLVRNGSITVGTAAAGALYFVAMFNPINALLGLFDEVQKAGAALARLVGIAGADVAGDREASPAVPAPVGRPLVPLPVELRGVSFGYTAGHEVLHDVDLDVAAGERVAIVGVSGAGKTTLARLVAGLHDPTAGAITVGGIAVGDLDPHVATVVLVSQETHVFAGTLAADLRLVRPDATEDDLRTALGTVGALDWVDNLPAGLLTEVGEHGHPLTATQTQQLALARLMLADPPVAILDEATAEAGSSGARELEEAAAAALAGRTAIVIAHRLTQAAEADRIVVMADGRVAEVGTHADLSVAGGDYQRLWGAWSSLRPA